MRVLFSEGSSLTARGFASVLGPAGHHIEVMDPDPRCLLRWCRWVRRIHPCPPSGLDASGYLRATSSVLRRDGFDVLLPTHEQAWLFAVGRRHLPEGVGLAVSGGEAFARVESKVAFAELLDELSLPQPAWCRVAKVTDLPDWA